MSRMIIAILADDTRKEIEGKSVNDDVEIIWVDSLQSLRMIEADAYFDFLFDNTSERIARLKFLLPTPVFINDVIGTCSETGNSFIRINGWPTMLGRDAIEVAAADDMRESAISCIQRIGWKVVQVPDVPGMITPRIVSMIINEAFYALSEGVSSIEQIDTAMKLGTNYPFGPFEWLDKIGKDRVAALLRKLSDKDSRYTIAPMLKSDYGANS